MPKREKLREWERKSQIDLDLWELKEELDNAQIRRVRMVRYHDEQMAFNTDHILRLKQKVQDYVLKGKWDAFMRYARGET